MKETVRRVLRWGRGGAGGLGVLTLMARHGTEKYAAALPRIEEIFRRRMPGVARRTVVIDNALPQGSVEPERGGITVIGGDNSAWEFSAWDEGLRFVGPELDGYDLVHLATSAFDTLYTGYLKRFDAALLAEVARLRIACGHIDYYDEPVTFLADVSQHWVRSSFLFLPPMELRRLGSLVSVGPAQRAALFLGDPAAPFRADAPMSENYKRYVADWLLGTGTGQGTEWHSRFELTAGTLDFFEQKAVAILNEHMLSVRLRAQGCALADTTWAAATLARDGHLPNLTPPWRVQLAGRDRNAVPLEKTRPHRT
ncbi:hypothetical protein ACFW16_31210 [Inquilinus sp. NPDC058860]|uniref:hypothetical protein n=1 Tax=Inquilinus sp. NPDC058860 TaxID=3346652 RepID=UPI003687290A